VLPSASEAVNEYDDWTRRRLPDVNVVDRQGGFAQFDLPLYEGGAQLTTSAAAAEPPLAPDR
jgi:hypothetical protein